jgi:hypothetical protein
VSDEEDAFVAAWAGVTRFLSVFSVIFIMELEGGRSFRGKYKYGKSGRELTLCSRESE